MRAFFAFASAALVASGCYLAHERPAPDAGVDLERPDAPIDLSLDGVGCACGPGTRCCPLCVPDFECLDPSIPCPVPDCPDPSLCPDGTECAQDDMCCPGCEGAYLCSPRIFGICPDVDCPACWPMNAEGTGDCALFLGVAWNGSDCVFLSGCACEGRDCGSLFQTLEACVAAYEGCAMSG